MDRQMRSISFLSDNEHVHIAQPDSGDGVQEITITVCQIDILIGWLKDAKAENEENAKL